MHVSSILAGPVSRYLYVLCFPPASGWCAWNACGESHWDGQGTFLVGGRLGKVINMSRKMRVGITEHSKSASGGDDVHATDSAGARDLLLLPVSHNKAGGIAEV